MIITGLSAHTDTHIEEVAGVEGDEPSLLLVLQVISSPVVDPNKGDVRSLPELLLIFSPVMLRDELQVLFTHGQNFWSEGEGVNSKIHKAWERTSLTLTYLD